MSIGPRHRSEKSAAPWIALLLSLLLHVPLLVLFGVYRPDPGEVLERTNFDATAEFSIDLVTEVEEPKIEDPVEKQDLQIVSLEAPEVEEKPEEARFADRYESKADKEMVRKALPGALARPRAPVPQQESPPRPDETEGETEQQPAPEETPPSPELDSDGVEMRREQQESAAPRTDPSELFPSLHDAQAAEMLGEGGSIDYLRDVAEGDKTLLNRKRTRYWAFFDRVKQQISKTWAPVDEYRKRDPYGNVYGVKDRYSTVDVTLNGDGTVRRLYLSRASGLDFFDDEAVRALQAAAPFHNPPEGLKDQDGLIHFTFGFYFEISSGKFRFIRVNN